MYLVDGGAPAIMWRYIRPQAEQYVGAGLVAVASFTGWYIVGVIRGRRVADRGRRAGAA
jgi:hypothetical protein